jgi:putative Mn2+ efflux pump MntP
LRGRRQIAHIFDGPLSAVNLTPIFATRGNLKIAGIILTVLGALLILSGLNVAFQQYNLNDSHDLSKALGGFAFALLILAIGVSLLVKSRGKP